MNFKKLSLHLFIAFNIAFSPTFFSSKGFAAGEAGGEFVSKGSEKNEPAQNPIDAGMDIISNDERELGKMVIVDVAEGFDEKLRATLGPLFLKGGDVAVANHLLEISKDPNQIEQLRKFAGSEQIVSVKVHPNKMDAINHINERSQRTGFRGLQFKPDFDPSLPDPKASNPKTWVKVARMGAAAGAVIIAALYANAANFDANNASNSFWVLLPAIGGAVISVCLELQFAWPTVRDRFWSPLWTKNPLLVQKDIPVAEQSVLVRTWNSSTPLISSRSINFGVNAAYGAIVGFATWLGYRAALGAGIAAEKLARYDTTFYKELKEVLKGAGLFTLAAGQFQTDINNEALKYGTMSSTKAFNLESVTVIINGTARVASIALAMAGIQTYVSIAFASIMTVPQVYRTHIQRRIVDRKLRNNLGEVILSNSGGGSCEANLDPKSKGVL